MSDEQINLEGSVLDSTATQYGLIERLGKESAEGRVYRATYKGVLGCAVKIVDPDALHLETASQILETEVRLMSVLRHSNIVRIIDFGVGAPTRPSSSVPAGQKSLFSLKRYFFVVMEHVPGMALDAAWRNRSAAEVLHLLEQLFGAVAYLHSRGVLHMDLKPANVLVERESDNVVIIDLGFSVVADADRFKHYFGYAPGWAQTLQDDQLVYLAGTEEFTPEEHIPLLRSWVRRSDIRDDWYPGQDLFGLSRIIKLALAETLSNASLSIRQGLEIVADRLRDDRTYTASRARDDIARLHPGALAPIAVPELSPIVDDGSYVAHAHGPIPTTARVGKVIEHRLFQRLRDIPQLERENLLFVNARHSRHSHSLLCFEMARLALTYMLGSVEFRLAISTTDAEAVLLFALLHDIGHYPLSHMFEDWTGKDTRENDPILRDDDLFQVMMSSDPASRFRVSHDALSSAIGNDSLPLLIEREFGADVLAAIRSISACAGGYGDPSSPTHRVLAGLVSSAVDVDKIAYLWEDSSMTGVAYGHGVDIHGFLSALRLQPDLARSTSTRPTLCLHDKGLAAAESIIFARYGMLKRVYWHHTNRAVQAAYKHVIGELITGRALSFGEYLKDCFWKDEIEATRYLQKKFMDLPRDTGGRRTRRFDPLAGLLDGRRDVYRRLLTISYLRDPALHSRLTEGEEARATAIAREVVGRLVDRPIQSGEIVVDVPRSGRDHLDLESILVVGSGTDASATLNLKSASLILGRIEQETLDQVKKCRVFAATGLMTEIAAERLESRTRAALLEAFEAQLS